jgi:hypothetical protein
MTSNDHLCEMIPHGFDALLIQFSQLITFFPCDPSAPSCLYRFVSIRV